MDNKEKVKIIFFGTPEFAAGVLKSLIDNGYNIAAVFTQPDKKVGRKQVVAYSPVKDLALKNKIEVFQPESLRDSGLDEEIKKINPDLFIVAAYGKILPETILGIPKYGAINIHASLLPKYRGASPVQCAILSGENETGITLMKMNEKMDEGDILVQKKIEIGENETADILLGRLSQLGAKMIVDFAPRWISGKINLVPQDHSHATYCKRVLREDGKIEWNSAVEEIGRKWRSYYPWPGIYSILSVKNQPKRLKLLEIEIIPDVGAGEKTGKIIEYDQEVAIQAKNGLVILKKIQLEGKKEMDVDDFLKGFANFVGSILE
ncbi:MAG: methionyl-tRNA formyltransferase [Parcubacteria group bacterium]|jgi:methionyl-tRNA formyltransferase